MSICLAAVPIGAPARTAWLRFAANLQHAAVVMSQFCCTACLLHLCCTACLHHHVKVLVSRQPSIRIPTTSGVRNSANIQSLLQNPGISERKTVLVLATLQIAHVNLPLNFTCMVQSSNVRMSWHLCSLQCAALLATPYLG